MVTIKYSMAEGSGTTSGRTAKGEENEKPCFVLRNETEPLGCALAKQADSAIAVAARPTIHTARRQRRGIWELPMQSDELMRWRTIAEVSRRVQHPHE